MKGDVKEKVVLCLIYSASDVWGVVIVSCRLFFQPRYCLGRVWPGAAEVERVVEGVSGSPGEVHLA
jgi:hypothetical protein